jgi:antitoxin HicB
MLMNYEYSVVFSRDRNGTVIAEAPDVPGTMTVGKDRDEALARIQDALVAMLATYVRERRPVPKPSRSKRGQPTVPVPAMVAAKLALHSAVMEQRLTQVALARKLRTDPRQVRRLLDLEHYSRLERVESALSSLGKQLVVNVRDAA